MGKIKMSGYAKMEFEPDFYKFCIKIELIAKTSNEAITEGKKITENLLTELENKLDIKPEDVIAHSEGTTYCNVENETEPFEFNRELNIIVNADHGITETITDIIKNFNNIDYRIEPILSNRSEKERLVINTAVEDSRNRAEMLISSLDCNIVGFEEIEYNCRDSYEQSVCHKIGSVKRTVSKSARLANEKIVIKKDVTAI